MDDPAIVGFRLRHVREERGMSQAALASGICSASAVSRWESGQCVPSDEIIVQLADRLALPAEVLTRRDFDSRLLTSGDGFGEVVEASFDTGRDTAGTSPMASWISRVRQVSRHADPWTSGPDPRPMVDDLAVDPLTVSVPVSVETVELLDAMVRVKETQDRETVDALADTLSWTVDAPEVIRRTALETVIAVLVGVGMPVAARGAAVRTGLPRITATTAALLTWDGSSDDGLPPVAADRSARDVAFDVLSRLRDMPGDDRQRVAALVAASCPGDGLVSLWAG
ncbi:helix-turn-helix domain-containing protein [Corynebacterium kalidii]|uniref:Helix-turn-helix domain-containing protein n=1 Tax=Corynebacterium kalidii TaxID=2931982 RepID=A0A9X1WE34_9CORY|nr:helix-turn-helix transcriptional regulator [Corynebacterium kalidii]MCJ7857329.1 helix-turn-helix domain-containing protein [Corynebacterium kalidii]